MVKPAVNAINAGSNRKDSPCITNNIAGCDREGNLLSWFPKRRVVTPPAINILPVEGPRTFDGEFRQYWRVGDQVEFRKTFKNSLPVAGQITRATFGAKGDLYDVKLNNGDIVLNTPSMNLQAMSFPFWQEAVLGVVLCVSLVWFSVSVMACAFKLADRISDRFASFLPSRERLNG